MAVFGNFVFGIAAHIHENILSDDEDSDGLLESLDIEGAVIAAKLHQIQRSQIAGGIIDKHIFAAWIGGIDGTGIGAGMPAVDGGVVLHSRVAANSGSFGNQTHQFAGGVGLHGLSCGDGAGGPGVVFFNGFHKLIREPDGQIAVLEHNAVVGVVGVVALLDKCPGLFFFLGFAGDELFDVGMVDFEGLHFGSPAGLSAGFDDGGDLVIDAHET